MIQERIAKLEATLREAENLSPETRQELLAILADLRVEVAPLASTHDENAQTITHFTEASVQEATRRDRQPAETEAALAGLTSSVEGFEASHPALVGIVNRLAVTLSNMGI